MGESNDNEIPELKGKCVLCGIKAPENDYLCYDCKSEWLIDMILGTIDSFNEKAKTDIFEAIKSPEASILRMAGILLSGHNITEIIPRIVGFTTTYALNGNLRIPLDRIIDVARGREKTRILGVLMLMKNAGAIKDIDITNNELDLGVDNLLGELAKVEKIDIKEYGYTELVPHIMSGYTYIAGGIKPIYDRFLMGEDITMRDGILIIYPTVRSRSKGTKVPRVPRGIFSTFVSLMKVLRKAKKNEPLSESEMIYELIMTGKVGRGAYLKKILPKLLGTHQDASPVMLGKWWKTVDPEKRLFVFEDYLIDERDRIRERGTRIRERIRERMRGEE